jgi:hypothetical protein
MIAAVGLLLPAGAGFVARGGVAPRPSIRVRLCAADLSAGDFQTAPQPSAPPSAAAAAAAALASMEFSGWGEREEWALQDAVPKYSLEAGTIVLWRRMSLEVPELFTFSAAELRARWVAMAGPDGAEKLAKLQDEPPYLEDWVCVGPGRYEGALYNVPSMRDGSLRGTVEHFERIETPRSLADSGATKGGGAAEALECAGEALDGTRRWVRTRDGALFQLGLPKDAEAAISASSSLNSLSAESGGLRPFVGGLDGDGLAEGAGAMVGAAKGVGSMLGPPLLVGGGVLVLSAMAYMVLGHHHVDVSVFIV